MNTWVSPIPQKVHLIWIGNNDFPDYFNHFLESFKKNFDGFEIKVWGNKDLNRKNFPLTFDYIQKAKKLQGKQMIDQDGYKMFNKDMEPLLYSKWAQITDLMRLEIVYNVGGYYFDTTFEILKPMFKLLNKKNKRFVGCNEVPRFKNHNILSNSFFGATPRNPILKRLLSKDRLSNIDFYDQAVDFQTGPGYLRSGIRLNDNFHIFPTKFFYPFVEEYEPGVDPPYRKSAKNKCHSKKKKKTMKKLKSKKGFIKYPCDKYPDSYALKHWQLGKSWLVTEYYT
jgi:mannosyltransferase OCH1-like enzyme|tara:strand:- start:935 stop:1780 length:846 start_codon:yes stop_codon:yes gene_type:complete